MNFPTARALHLVVNGKVSANAALREAVTRIRSEGVRVSVCVTWEAGDAARFACEAGGHDGVTVVAAGGDGTVNEVINGLIDSSPVASFAIVPMGTANDFAHGAGIPIGKPYDALSLASRGALYPVDVGTVNDRRFLNVASGGLGAEATSSTPRALKATIGPAAYALTALLMSLKGGPHNLRLTCNGETRDFEAAVVAVGNATRAGGGVPLTPNARVDDGLLDLLIVPQHEHAEFAGIIHDMLELKHGRTTRFDYYRLSNFRLDVSHPLQFNLDGEPMHALSFQFGVLNAALKMALPASCALVQRPSQGSAAIHSEIGG